jgi:hypothetical protein
MNAPLKASNGCCPSWTTSTWTGWRKKPSSSCARWRPASSALPCCFPAARTAAWCCAWPRKAFKNPAPLAPAPQGGAQARQCGQFKGKLPFPLLHVDTGHNFPEVIEFRDRRVAEMGERLVVGHLEDSIRRGTVRLSHPLESRNGHQTVALLEAIEEHRFDCLIGGARRDEEKARAKERIFSHRDSFGQWQPKEQRPELWTLFNTRIRPGEHFRAFPISNWTELDVWLYLARENIPLPELYYATSARWCGARACWCR